ncbi:hypothetical protein K492DRAFT_69808 [Lichtheimia hyalospora FSU 10163]|nr:hypothetical protein K492DRAFT_69808 [Lichtheimia hyalospora FSU 10163]
MTSRYTIGCDRQLPHQCFGKQLPGTLVFYWWIITATRNVIGAIAIFFLVDIDLQVPVRVPWMFLDKSISSCVLWSRPGLFVPTLFVMHDVSLTPTKKVA